MLFPFFASRLAIFASVLVGAIPTDTGIPVHRRTVRANSSPHPVSPPPKPARSRNASSMEYTSSAGTRSASTCITRRDMSPYNA